MRPSEEMVTKAKSLIEGAIACGVLKEVDNDHIAVIYRFYGQGEEWVSVKKSLAAIDLVEQDKIEILEEAIKATSGSSKRLSMK